MFLKKFEILRIAAWLIDVFLFYIFCLLMLLVSDLLLRINMYEIGEQLGFKTTIASDVLYNSFVEFWEYVGQYVLLYIPAILYLLLSGYFSKQCFKGSSIGKWIMKLDVADKEGSNFRFILSTIVVLFLYYIIPYIFLNFSIKVSWSVIVLMLFDIVFIFIKGQLFHNYLFGIKIIHRVPRKGTS